MVSPISPAAITQLHAALLDGMDVSFRMANAAKENWFPRIARKDTGDLTTVRYPFSYETVGMNRQPAPLYTAPTFQQLLTQYVNLQVGKFMDGAELRVNDFADPVIQQMLMDKVMNLPLSYMLTPLYRCCDALRLGDTDPYYTVYDGQQYFSTTHAVGPNNVTYRNLYSGLLYDPSDVGAVFNEVKSNMRKIPWGPNGRYLPMAGAKWIILVPPQQEVNADKLVRNTYYLQNNIVGDNPYSMSAQNIGEVIVEENLVTQDDPDNKDWYVIAVIPQANIRSFLWYEQNALGSGTLVPNIDLTSPNMFYNDLLQWKLQGWLEVFPGQFFLAAKIKEPS